MRFDNIIIGGGLAGLICGLKLQKAGKKCAIVSAGQSAMHFSSGTFDLLGRLPDGTAVTTPLEAVSLLNTEHPYSIMGKEKFGRYSLEAEEFLKACGIEVKGHNSRNSWRITPTGERKATWLSLPDFTPLESENEKLGDKILIVNISGYLDFNTRFLADAFESQGSVCRIVSVQLDEMERLRKNPSEMRSTNIATVLEREGVWKKLAAKIMKLIQDDNLLVLPAVFGLRDTSLVEKMRNALDIKTIFISTMPPSVPGIRTQIALKTEFKKAGGYFFLGDSVIEAAYMEDGSVESVKTSNFGDIKLYADNFILASGSFFSKGLTAAPDKVYEPVFNIDLHYSGSRSEWFGKSFWDRQNYISFGAKANKDFQLSISGKTIGNLYGIGSILGGSNPLYEACGGGIAILTAMAAADSILKKTGDTV